MKTMGVLPVKSQGRIFGEGSILKHVAKELYKEKTKRLEQQVAR